MMYDIAISKNDEENLLQIQDKDCVGIGAVLYEIRKRLCQQPSKVKEAMRGSQRNKEVKENASVDNTPTLTFYRLCSHIFEEWIIN